MMRIRVRSLTVAALLLCASVASGQTLTTITDTLVNADGTRANCKLEISWPQFKTSDNFSVTANRKTEAVIGGAVSFKLAPNAGATPAGTVYTVDYSCPGVHRELWTVPASGPVTIASMITAVAPSPAVEVAQHQLTLGTGFGVLLELLSQGTAPTATQAGQCYYDTAGDVAKCTNNALAFVALGGAGGSPHNLLSATHSDTTANAGALGDLVAKGASAWARLAGNTTATKNFLTSTGDGAASALPAWGTIADGDLPASIARDSELHAQSHVLATTAGLGADHTTSGLTAGQVLRASAATAAAFAALGFADLSGAATDAQIPDSITISLAAAATALAADPGDCSGNNFALGIAASGAAACAQPAFTNLSGAATKAQIPAAVAYEDEANIFTVAGALTLDNQLGLRLREGDAGGDEYVELRAPAAITTSYTLTLPAADAAGFFRTSGAGVVSFNAASGTGTCTNQAVTALADNAAPTCTTITSAYVDSSIASRTGAQTLQNKVIDNTNTLSGYTDWTEIAAPGSPAASTVRVYAKTASGELCSKSSGGVETCMSAGAGGSHAMLSATHSDTTAAAVARGDLITGQTATPVWQRLAVGAANRVLASDGTDAAWTVLAKAHLPASVAYEDEANIFTLAGALTLDNQLGLRLREGDAGGDEYVELRAPAAITTSYTLTLPAADAAGSLRSNGSGTVSFAAASGAGACAANTFASTLSDNAAPTCTQPAFTNLTGTATKAQLPAAVAYEDEANIFTVAGALTLDNQLGLRLREADGTGDEYIELRAASAITTSFTWTFPAADALGFLRSDGAGALSLVGETGSGSVVRATSPTMTTPVIASIVNTGTLTLPTSTDTLVARATTDTLTNKTIDAEATGNVITQPVKIWIPAAGCNNVTASSNWDLPTSLPAVAACVTGTNTQKGVLDFANGASVLTAQQTLMLPSVDWTGAIDARVKWLTAAIAGDVVWQVAIACVADAETDDPAFTDTVFTADTAKGTTLQTNDAGPQTITTTGTCAAGELAHVRIKRDPGHASDTMTDTARLIGVELTLRRAM